MSVYGASDTFSLPQGTLTHAYCIVTAVSGIVQGVFQEKTHYLNGWWTE